MSQEYKDFIDHWQKITSDRLTESVSTPDGICQTPLTESVRPIEVKEKDKEKYLLKTTPNGSSSEDTDQEDVLHEAWGDFTLKAFGEEGLYQGLDREATRRTRLDLLPVCGAVERSFIKALKVLNQKSPGTLTVAGTLGTRSQLSDQTFQ